MNSLFSQSAAVACCLAVGTFAVLLARPQRQLELTPQQETQLKGRTILITGATNGIGLGLTRVLYKRMGASIIVIGRSPSKLQRLKEEMPNIQTFQADLADLDSVAKTCDTIVSNVDSIDIIVNNAGIHALYNMFSTKTVPVLPDKHMDEVFVVNYLSHNLLFEKLQPLLQKSKHGKVVQISSNFHWAVDGSDLQVSSTQPVPIASYGSHGYHVFRTQRSYANSKLAQLYQARAWQKEYPQLQFSSICPGWVGTGIGGTGLMRWILAALAFPNEGWGVSSVIRAVLDNDSNEQGDFYINTDIFRIANVLMPKATASWFYQLALRDLVIGTAAYTVLVFQRFFANVGPMRSSPESYNEERGKALSEWSHKALEAYL